MKKFVTLLACAVISVACALGFSACKKGHDEFDVYAPDGAPALALAYAMSVDDEDTFGIDVDFDIVDSALIQTYVTGKNPRADICVLPVTAACKLLGDASQYLMVGTVTNGNLFILSTTEGEITKDNLSAKLLGKTVGVIQLQNVPGLTFKAILNDNEIPYADVSDKTEAQQGRVNLIEVEASDVPAVAYDYYVLAEPAVTAKLGATASAAAPLKNVGNLQTMYGDGNGYPQAVMVAKKSVIEHNKTQLSKFIEAVDYNSEWIKTADPAYVMAEIRDNLEDGLQPSFKAQNLNATTIKNCAIKFTSGLDGKDAVLTYINKVLSVSDKATSVPADEFFTTV